MKFAFAAAEKHRWTPRRRRVRWEDSDSGMYQPDSPEAQCTPENSHLGRQSISPTLRDAFVLYAVEDGLRGTVQNARNRAATVKTRIFRREGK